MSNPAPQPVSIMIAAMGGEGGGVLAEWIVSAAAALSHPVQSSSIPGVSQRTGATTYYVELCPVPFEALKGKPPAFTLAPVPGQVDVLIASELLEAGRAMMNGYVSPQRTTLIAATHRVYTTVEKMQMGDGRYDAQRIVDAAGSLARRALLADLGTLAARSGAMLNSVLFGALAASGATPLTRAACEQAIRAGGKGVEASLKGFALGFDAISVPAGGVDTAPESVLHTAPPLARVGREFAPETHSMIELGVARCQDFLDTAYAGQYLDRLVPIAALDRSEGRRLTSETARFLALWMCYEDIIRVADLKSRRSRFERVRREVRAQPHEPVRMIEYFKPRLEEFAAILPAWLARPLIAWSPHLARFTPGLHLHTTSIHGFLLLRTLASLRPLRRASSRFREEQAIIERWLAAIANAAQDQALATEIALCGRLIKGYGDTHQRGKDNFLRILEALVEGKAGAKAEEVRLAREAALADAGGRTLDLALAAHGVVPRPVKAQPVKFIRRPTEQSEAA